MSSFASSCSSISSFRMPSMTNSSEAVVYLYLLEHVPAARAMQLEAQHLSPLIVRIILKAIRVEKDLILWVIQGDRIVSILCRSGQIAFSQHTLLSISLTVLNRSLCVTYESLCLAFRAVHVCTMMKSSCPCFLMIFTVLATLMGAGFLLHSDDMLFGLGCFLND